MIERELLALSVTNSRGASSFMFTAPKLRGKTKSFCTGGGTIYRYKVDKRIHLYMPYFAMRAVPLDVRAIALNYNQRVVCCSCPFALSLFSSLRIPISFFFLSSFHHVQASQLDASSVLRRNATLQSQRSSSRSRMESLNIRFSRCT
ncbi:hypothetical protein P5V15_007925 [Pogonomyrmex californicus]